MSRFSLNSRTLADYIAGPLQITKSTASTYVKAIIKKMQEAACMGHNIDIQDFGTFSKRQKNARTGSDPRTHQPTIIKARTVLAFKPAKMLRKRIAENIGQIILSKGFSDNE